jgi:fumarylacetoacetate (FAA) hydrolase family protein
MRPSLPLAASLPEDQERATLVGRAWLPQAGGPSPVLVRADGVYDLSGLAPTCSHLLNLPDPVAAIRETSALPRVGATADILANSAADGRDAAAPWFLAPCDLQAIKASGVTFVSSLLERVIEEQARGDAARAESVRKAIVGVIGEDLARVRPGSDEALRLKEVLIAQGAWSQYLEVGIGADAEIFTKTQPMASVGTGADVGVHPRSQWSNPEPEVVLAVGAAGRVAGATLGNDVNLRDFEGRSALLLGRAKDNNGSCAIGPFIRLFDEGFGMDAVRRAILSLRVEGEDGFVLQGESSMAMISRDPLDLVAQATGPCHQYPDGMMLFLGTMFAPTEDRFAAGQGFTHAAGDVVSISTASLGTLVNRVSTSDRISAWTFGATALMSNLARRGLL